MVVRAVTAAARPWLRFGKTASWTWMQKSRAQSPTHCDHPKPNGRLTTSLRCCEIERQNGRAVLITSSDATGMHSNPFHLRTTPRALPHDGSIRRRPAKSWPCPPIQPSNISNATTDTPLARVLGSCGHNAFNTWRQHAARSFRRTRRTLQ